MIRGASRLMHMPVLDSQDKFVGTVHDIYINPHTMQLAGIAAGDHLIDAKAIKNISYKVTLTVDINSCFKQDILRHHHASHDTRVHT